jgi:superfamily II DNA/RNA helicase
MTTFANYGLPATLVQSLEKMGITTPTPIQSETIPIALQGSDILASAQTGSGKTIAYLIPVLQKLATDPQASALVLAPTRELAMQVHQALIKMAGSSLKTSLLIGGASMGRQFGELKRRPRVIVGTPGRINDHLERGSLNLSSTRFLVIDEADRMLDMGFGIQLDQIAKHLSGSRQTLLFSATMPPNIMRLSERFLKEPKRISVDTTNMPAPKIQQETIHTSSAEKKAQLIKQLETREGSIIVFVKTRRKAEAMSKELRVAGHNTDAMHGDLRQSRREQVIRAFRSEKCRILVATDVAARGLDIPHVMHVINYDLPECPEDYVHRIGRTGRAGAEGFALSLVSPEDNHRWRAISRMLNPKAPREEEPGAPAQNNNRRPQQRRFGRGRPGGGGNRFGKSEGNWKPRKFSSQGRSRPN